MTTASTANPIQPANPTQPANPIQRLQEQVASLTNQVEELQNANRDQAEQLQQVQDRTGRLSNFFKSLRESYLRSRDASQKAQADGGRQHLELAQKVNDVEAENARLKQAHFELHNHYVAHLSENEKQMARLLEAVNLDSGGQAGAMDLDQRSSHQVEGGDQNRGSGDDSNRRERAEQQDESAGATGARGAEDRQRRVAELLASRTILGLPRAHRALSAPPGSAAVPMPLPAATAPHVVPAAPPRASVADEASTSARQAAVPASHQPQAADAAPARQTPSVRQGAGATTGSSTTAPAPRPAAPAARIRLDNAGGFAPPSPPRPMQPAVPLPATSAAATSAAPAPSPRALRPRNGLEATKRYLHKRWRK